MTLRAGSSLLLVVLLSGLLTGCASVKTVPGTELGDGMRLRRPSHIWVRPFATTGGMWQGTVSAPERREEIRDWLTASLLQTLTPIAPTHLLEDDPPNSGWLVTGRFLRVNPGSTVGRLFLGGVGAGASKLETRVEVYDLAVSATEPMLTFTTTGGSNLAAGIPGALSATDDDVERTAREIRDYLAARLWPEGTGEGAPQGPAALDEIEITPARNE